MQVLRILMVAAIAASCFSQDVKRPGVSSIDPRTGRAIGAMQEVIHREPAKPPAPLPMPSLRLGAVRWVPERVDVPCEPVTYRAASGRGKLQLRWSGDTRVLVSGVFCALDFVGVIPDIAGVTLWGNPENPPYYIIAARREDHGDSCNHWLMDNVEITGAVRAGGAAVLNDCMEVFRWSGLGLNMGPQNCGYTLELSNQNPMPRLLRSLRLSDVPDTEISKRTLSKGTIEDSGLYNYADNPDGIAIVKLVGADHIEFNGCWFAGTTDLMHVELPPAESWLSQVLAGGRRRVAGGRVSMPSVVLRDCTFEGSGVMQGKHGIIRLGPGVPRSAVTVDPSCDFIDVVETSAVPPAPSPASQPIYVDGPKRRGT